MRFSFLTGVAAVAASFASAGCQWVADIQSQKADPLTSGCAFSTHGDSKVRLAHLAATNQRVDFCVKPSDQRSYGRPLLRDAGAGCVDKSLPASLAGHGIVGMGYSQVTQAMPFASGPVDVKVIAWDDTHSCNAPALATLSGVTLASALPQTLALLGGGAEPLRVVALPEADPRELVPSTATKVRFVNAMPGVAHMSFGNVSIPATLPTTITMLIPDVAFGHASPSSFATSVGSTDAYGYLSSPTLIPLAYGASNASESNNALLGIDLSSQNKVQTLFAIGDPAQPLYPPRGLMCREAAPATQTLESPFLKVGSATDTTADCRLSDPPSLIVDTLMTSMFGAYSPIPDVRLPYLAQAIAQSPADLLCLGDLYETLDREAVKAALKLPDDHFAMATTDLSTVADDNTDAQGNPIAAPTAAPCGDPTAISSSNAAYQCLSPKCCQGSNCAGPNAGLSGDATRYAPGSIDALRGDCQSSCTDPYLALYQSNKACYNCVAANVVSFVPFSEGQTECQTNVQAGYAFKGKSPSILISKRYPLANVSKFVLPSTMFRRTWIRAEVKLDTQTTVDVYCGQLTTIQGDIIPYTGAFSNDTTINGWRAEQTALAHKVANWIKKTTPKGRPAIILGELDSSREYKDPGSGKVVVGEQNEATMQAFEESFKEAVDPNYTPACTYCYGPANPYNANSTDTQGYWSNHAYLYQFTDPAPAFDSKQVYTEAPVPIPKAAQGTGQNQYNSQFGPVAGHYGYRVKLKRPTSQE